MNLTESLLEALRCPETKQPLRLANAEEMQAVNAIRVRENKPPPDAALIREDGEIAYPIIDGFPILLVEEAIRLS